MGKIVFTEGDTFEYLNEDGEMRWQAGMHIPAANHWQAVVCYGATEEEATERRNALLSAYKSCKTSEQADTGEKR